ncbi:hypothetical protein OJ997_05735 [Solirubrobacter phytolaccae]|uniref:DUF3828 domain-containing protein n=1 Tax=Solirubrobacter phytolaccae TaxID=1404360 RepID=A0A9X3N8X9_9ACTN|nr:hypothetical protein [Solirubrobacter phytolaccae]MDA0179786.1 hypothetical protein [Solirubrobacter phytolaccae]
MRWIAVLIASGLLAGCGETVAEPKPQTTSWRIETVGDAGPQRSVEIKRVVRAFDRHWRRGDYERVCALMTPETQANLAALLKAPSCLQAFGSELYAGSEPPAVRHAAAREYRSVRVDETGTSATITFPDCRTWRLVRRDGTWLINDFPIVPSAVRVTAPRCEA